MTRSRASPRRGSNVATRLCTARHTRVAQIAVERAHVGSMASAAPPRRRANRARATDLDEDFDGPVANLTYSGVQGIVCRNGPGPQRIACHT